MDNTLIVTGKMSSGENAPEEVMRNLQMRSLDEDICLVTGTKIIPVKSGRARVELRLGPYIKTIEVNVFTRHARELEEIKFVDNNIVLNQGDTAKIIY